MRIISEEKNMKISQKQYVKFNHMFIGRLKGYQNLCTKLSRESLMLICLIYSRRTYDGRARIILDEFMDWYGIVHKQWAKDKIIDLLNIMVKNNLLTYTEPYVNYFLIDDISKIISKPERYIQLDIDEINKIRSIKSGIKINDLLGIFISIKTYIHSNKKVGFPSRLQISKDLNGIRLNIISDSILLLQDNKLIKYTNRGWDSENQKNMGHIYCLWDDYYDGIFDEYIISPNTVMNIANKKRSLKMKIRYAKTELEKKKLQDEYDTLCNTS